MEFRIRAHKRGPMFDGRARVAAAAMAREIEEEVGQEAYNQVQIRLSRVLKHPTGYYQSRIKVDGDRVHDSRVVYGPWLEGVGSRNFPKTRFKGYFTFRIVRQFMERHKAKQIAERVFYRYRRRFE